ncbi:MAG: molybdate ABC transporter substrate-binding protein, partial [Gammaproteobacteria bacterium]|nr:molybdate ABC transporter substrate-binding protein [Gammaproteobacteria bacterium]
MHIPLRTLIVSVSMLCGLMASPVQAGEVSVAVASNFAATMERLAPLFQKESGHTVNVTPGASG